VVFEFLVLFFLGGARRGRQLEKKGARRCFWRDAQWFRKNERARRRLLVAAQRRAQVWLATLDASLPEVRRPLRSTPFSVADARGRVVQLGPPPELGVRKLASVDVVVVAVGSEEAAERQAGTYRGCIRCASS